MRLSEPRPKDRWEKGFALLPIYIGNQIDNSGYWVWLEPVERRPSGAWEGRFLSKWVYRIPQKDRKEDA